METVKLKEIEQMSVFSHMTVLSSFPLIALLVLG